MPLIRQVLGCLSSGVFGAGVAAGCSTSRKARSSPAAASAGPAKAQSAVKIAARSSVSAAAVLCPAQLTRASTINAPTRT